MIDPTGLNEQLKKDNKKPAMAFGRTFGTGLLGGVMGGLIFLGFKGFGSIDFIPFYILSGIGIVAMYFYFMDKERRNKKQLPVLFLSGLVAVFITLFFYILLDLYLPGGEGITMKNIYLAYFDNMIGIYIGNTFINQTILTHLYAYFFTALGIGATWLYIVIFSPRWEKKHRDSEPVRRSRRKR